MLIGVVIDSDTQLLDFPVLIILILDLITILVKNMRQSQTHPNSADELDKHNDTNLPVHTEIEGDSCVN